MVRYLLDTNILLRNPRGRVARRLAVVEEFARVPGLSAENWLTS
jgi:predicted nucleic acid-binding protein